MKIGIVTLIGNNYGGTLQAYALKNILEKEKNQVEIVNYQRKDGIKSFKRGIQNIVYINRNRKYKNFRKNNFKLTKKFESLEDLKKENFGYDAYIVGSDQVWNQDIIKKEELDIYFLNFVDNVRKISYAASIGKESLENIEKENIRDRLNNLDYISLREETGVNLCKELTKKEVVNVLDPTLLLDMEDWEKVTKEYKSKEKYICVYLLGPSKKTIENIDKMADELKLPINEISYKKNFKNTLKNENNFGPQEFLGIFKSAEAVITNSFHGTIFAILNKKPFWVYTRGNMNSRIFDLLKILGLENRIINENNFKMTKENINYEEVYRRLEEERKKSKKFLDKALNN